MSLRERLAYVALCVVREPFRRLPVEASLAFGAALGRGYAATRSRRVGFAHENLRIAFPDWSEERRREVLRESLANVGRTLAELALLQGPRRDRILAGVRIEGFENVDLARAQSGCKGVIAVTAHLGNWELGGMAVAAQGLALRVVHRPISNARIEAMVRGWRESAGLVPLPFRGAAAGALRALRDGHHVLMLIDQDCPRSEAIFSDFFGLPAATRKAPARLAMKTGAAVLPVSVERQGGGAHHVVRIGAPLALVPEGQPGALEDNVATMNRALEAMIRRVPTQWSWLHRRWRTRPEVGLSGPYASRRGGRARSLSRVLRGKRRSF